MEGCQLQLLGPVGLVVDGEPVALGGMRQRAIVAYLALQDGKPSPITQLVDDVWGASPPRTVVKSLSTLASRLRHVLRPHGIELRFDQHGYLLDLPERALDLNRFRADVGQARLAEIEGDTDAAVRHLRTALDRWRGAPLEGLVAPFVDPRSAELDAERDDTEQELARLLLAKGEHEPAIELLLALVDRHPFREDQWAALMAAYTSIGRRAEALAAYQRVRKLLLAEVDAEPGPLLRAAEQAALAAPEPGVPTRPRLLIPPRPAQRRTRIVGRDAELAFLEAEARTAALGEMRSTVVLGEPGIGKSHLVRAFLERMEERDVVVVAGRCDPFGTVPLGPLLSLVEKAGDFGLIDELVLADTPALVDAVAGRPTDQPLGDAGDLRRSTLLRELKLVLRRFSITRPVVVVLEDFHWVDTLTAAALRFLAGEQRQAPVLFVVTAREPDVAEGHCNELLEELGRRQTLQTIRLAPLGRDALRELVADELARAPAPEQLLDLIEAGAGGNPLYARQLARHVVDGDADAGSLPPDLRHLMMARIRTIPEEARELLVLGSVLGPTFTLEEVSRVFPDDLAGLERRAQLARTAGLLEPADGTDELRFVHGLMRRGAYELADRHQQALLHLAAAMIRGYGSAPADPEIVRHLDLARPVISDADLAAAVIEASRRSLEFGAHEMTIRLCGHTTDLELEPEVRAELQLLLGSALVSSGDHRGTAELDRAFAAARELGRWDLVCEALLARARIARLFSVTEARQRADHIAEALASGALHRGQRAQLLCVQVEALLIVDLAAARAVLDEPAVLATQLDRPELTRHLEHLRLALRAAAGLAPADVAISALQLVEGCAAAGDLIGAAHSAALAQASRVRAGLLRDCVEDAPRLLAIADGSGRADLAYQIRSATVSATMAIEPLGVGDQASDELANHALGAGTTLSGATRLLHLWLLRREQRRLHEIAWFFEQAVEAMDRPGGAAWVAACRIEEGNLDEARALLEPLPRVLLAAPPDWSRPAMVALLVDLSLELGLPLDTRRFAPMLRPLAGQNIVAAGSVQVLGRADRYLGRLAHLGGDLGAAVDHHTAARHLDQAGSSPLWASWAAHDEAAARLARGGPGDAVVAGALVSGALRTAKRLGARRLAAALRDLPV